MQKMIASAELNGKPYGHNFLRHSELERGARLHFTMSEEPVTTRGTAEEDAPYSFSREDCR